MENTAINLKNRITPDWKEFLRKYTTQQDVAQISLNNEMGYHTLHSIKNRTSNVSNEKNKKALEALIDAALENAKSKITETEKDIQSMIEAKKEILDY